MYYPISNQCASIYLPTYLPSSHQVPPLLTYLPTYLHSNRLHSLPICLWYLSTYTCIIAFKVWVAPMLRVWLVVNSNDDDNWNSFVWTRDRVHMCLSLQQCWTLTIWRFLVEWNGMDQCFFLVILIFFSCL
jgi:hypothetical protein